MTEPTKKELKQQLAEVTAEHAECPTFEVPASITAYTAAVQAAKKAQPKFTKNNYSAEINESGQLYLREKRDYRYYGDTSNAFAVSTEAVPAFLAWCAELLGKEPPAPQSSPMILTKTETEFVGAQWFFAGLFVGVLMTGCIAALIAMVHA